MVKAGIIDPLKVVRSALANAASIAGLMLTTEALVTNFEKDDKEHRVRRRDPLNGKWIETAEHAANGGSRNEIVHPTGAALPNSKTARLPSAADKIGLTNFMP